MDIKQIVETLEDAGVQVVQDESEAPAVVDQINKPFEFSKAVDLVGLPMEHIGYADRNCNDCYGRGFIRLVLVDGSVGRLFDQEPEDKRQVKNPNRRLRVCGCLHKGYTRFRLAYEASDDFTKTLRLNALLTGRKLYLDG